MQTALPFVTQAGIATSVPSHKGRRRCLSTATLLLFAIFGLFQVSPAKAAPISVSYSATTLGASQWTYTYTLAGTYAAEEDVSIVFPVASSSNLTDLGTGDSDWTTLVLQPDSALPADGEFDLVSQKDAPSLTALFGATFTYSGNGAPGPQTFVLYDKGFNQIALGTTSPWDLAVAPVPEPSSLVLLASGAAAFWKLKRSRSL